MLGHDFKDMPGKDVKTVGANPHETVNMLRCQFCMKTPAQARQDGCPIHELEETGKIRLNEFNPDGVAHFGKRACVSCDVPIMEHMLYRGSDRYWCPGYEAQFSDGIADCVFDVEGVAVPQEMRGPQG